MNLGESYDHLLMSLVKSTSISVDEREETGLLSQLRDGLCGCLSEGEWATQNIYVPLNGVW